MLSKVLAVGMILMPLILFMAYMSSNVIDNTRCASGVAEVDLDGIMTNGGQQMTGGGGKLIIPASGGGNC